MTIPATTTRLSILPREIWLHFAGASIVYTGKVRGQILDAVDRSHLQLNIDHALRYRIIDASINKLFLDPNWSKFFIKAAHEMSDMLLDKVEIDEIKKSKLSAWPIVITKYEHRDNQKERFVTPFSIINIDDDSLITLDVKLESLLERIKVEEGLTSCSATIRIKNSMTTEVEIQTPIKNAASKKIIEKSIKRLFEMYPLDFAESIIAYYNYWETKNKMK